MSKSVYTGLNTFNFIRKYFLQIYCETFLTDAVIAVFKSLSVRERSRYAADFAAPTDKILVK
jgi:hypothetical protein